jgi:thiol-disulfide isomerase/thioredoxin
MKKALIWILVTVLVVGLFVGAYFLYDYLQKQTDTGLTDIKETTAPAEENGEEPQPVLAPDFTVYTPEGEAVKLSQLQGKPVVLNLWTSWCIYCKQEMPDFEKLYERYGQDVHFLMVNVTGADTRAEAEKYIADSGHNFLIGRGDIQRTARIAALTGYILGISVGRTGGWRLRRRFRGRLGGGSGGLLCYIDFIAGQDGGNFFQNLLTTGQ